MRKIGAEAILAVIAAPMIAWLIWVVTSIFSLQANVGIDQVQLTQIKMLLEKQDTKLDKITTILIEKK